MEPLSMFLPKQLGTRIALCQNDAARNDVPVKCMWLMRCGNLGE